MDNLQNSGIARRTFVRRLALASGGLGLAGAGACAQAETGAAAEASTGEIAATDPPAFELYHEEHGEGPAVVFAHGAGGTHMSWWNQIPTFSQHYRCITYSQRGFGFSPDVAGGPGRGAFVEDLRGLLDNLGIERASLVGQSMGGRSVLGFAAAYPASTTPVTRRTGRSPTTSTPWCWTSCEASSPTVLRPPLTSARP